MTDKELQKYDPNTCMEDKKSYIVEWTDWHGKKRVYQCYAEGSLSAAFRCGQAHPVAVAKVDLVVEEDQTEERIKHAKRLQERVFYDYLDFCKSHPADCTQELSEVSVWIDYPSAPAGKAYALTVFSDLGSHHATIELHESSRVLSLEDPSDELMRYIEEVRDLIEQTAIRNHPKAN